MFRFLRDSATRDPVPMDRATFLAEVTGCDEDLAGMVVSLLTHRFPNLQRAPSICKATGCDARRLVRLLDESENHDGEEW